MVEVPAQEPGQVRVPRAFEKVTERLGEMVTRTPGPDQVPKIVGGSSDRLGMDSNRISKAIIWQIEILI
jgi:hypothetical protein